MAKEIEIIIKDKKKRKRTSTTSTEETKPTSKGPTKNKTKETDDGGEGETPSLLKSIAWQAGKQMLSAGMSQYANLTGDYVMAQNLNKLAQGVSFASQLISGDYMGATISALSTIANVYTNAVRNDKETELLRRRAGVFINGGRDTNE